MSFEINGNKGIYDSNIANNSVKYGRNAVENHHLIMEAPLVNDKHNPAPLLDYSGSENADKKNIDALSHFIDENEEYLKSLPPLEYEYRYMPAKEVGKVDNDAVLGAAYEEMGVKELSVEEFENRYLMDDTYTARPLDINNDGKIDIAEYGANIIATDLLSKGTTDVSKVDGKINSKGMNAIIEYTKKSNAEAASKLYTEIYNTYGLGNNLDKFVAE